MNAGDGMGWFLGGKVCIHLVCRVRHHAYLLSVGPKDFTVDINFTPMTKAGDIRFLQCKAIDLKDNVSKYKINKWWCALKYEKERPQRKKTLGRTFKM